MREITQTEMTYIAGGYLSEANYKTLANGLTLAAASAVAKGVVLLAGINPLGYVGGSLILPTLGVANLALAMHVANEYYPDDKKCSTGIIPQQLLTYFQLQTVTG